MQITSCEIANNKYIQIYLTEEELEKQETKDLINKYKEEKYGMAILVNVRRLFQSMRLTCVWSCPTCWKMRSKPVSALHQTDGRLKSLHTCMPGGCF